MTQENKPEALVDQEWDKPMTCPVDPAELSECLACQ